MSRSVEESVRQRSLGTQRSDLLTMVCEAVLVNVSAYVVEPTLALDVVARFV